MLTRILLLSLTIGLLSGCQSIRQVLNFKTIAEINIETTETINPDIDGRASPVIIHVFKLTDDGLFKREDFLSLYEDARSRLGDELIERQKLKEITPDEKRIDIIKMSKNVKYLGLMAEFVQYEGAQSILIFPIRSHNKNTYSVILDGNNMTTPKDPTISSQKPPAPVQNNSHKRRRYGH